MGQSGVETRLQSPGSEPLRNANLGARVPTVAISPDGSNVLIRNDLGNFRDPIDGQPAECSFSRWTRSNGTWSETAVVFAFPEDFVFEHGSVPHRFGESMDISNDGKTVAIGCPGEGYCLVYSMGDSSWYSWDEEAGNYSTNEEADVDQVTILAPHEIEFFGSRLFVSGSSLPWGYCNTRTFGQTVRVAADGNSVFVTAPSETEFFADDPEPELGTVWEFRRRGEAGGWYEPVPISPGPDDLPSKELVLGSSLDRSPDGMVLIVGAPVRPDGPKGCEMARGEAWIFCNDRSFLGDDRSWWDLALRACYPGDDSETIRPWSRAWFGSSVAVSPTGRTFAVVSAGEDMSPSVLEAGGGVVDGHDSVQIVEVGDSEPWGADRAEMTIELSKLRLDPRTVVARLLDDRTGFVAGTDLAQASRDTRLQPFFRNRGQWLGGRSIELHDGPRELVGDWIAASSDGSTLVVGDSWVRASDGRIVGTAVVMSMEDFDAEPPAEADDDTER